MFTRLLNKVRKQKPSRVITLSDPKKPVTKTFQYNVLVPGQTPVVLRGANQAEIRTTVRESLGLKRLPSGTSVTRL